MFLRWFLSVFLNAVALIVVAELLSPFHIDGFGTALLASVILSILNIFVRPLLVALTLPITFVTFGLFLFVINAITLLVTSKLMDSSFVIESFGTALIAAIIIAVINTLLHRIVKDTAK